MERIEILGIDEYGKKVYLTHGKTNNNLLIGGGSGTGKSTLLDSLLCQNAEKNAKKKIIRPAWHACTQRDQRHEAFSAALDELTFTVKAEDELPLKVFDFDKWNQADDQEKAREVHWTADTISRAIYLPETRRAEVLTCVEVIYKKNRKLGDLDPFKVLGSYLLELESAAALQAYIKLFPLVKGTNIKNRDIEFVKPICELDVDAYNDEEQLAIVKMAMSHFYRLARADRFKDHGLLMAVDEAQNLDLRRENLMIQMLMEGRKKKVDIILSTPENPAKVLRNDAYMSCETKVFFKPAGDEGVLAKYISAKQAKEITLELKYLDRGEFIACGKFIREDGILFNGPVKLRTYIPPKDTIENVSSEESGSNRGTVRVASIQG